MFKKLKERISLCENRVDSHSATIENIYHTINKLCKKTIIKVKCNSDILLDCVIECKGTTKLFVNGIQTMYEIDSDTPIEVLYRTIYKSTGSEKVTIHGYEIKGDTVNFTVETRGGYK